MREDPSLLTGEKRTSSKPQNRGALLHIRPATQKTNYEHEKLKKIAQIMWETKTTPQQTLKHESLLHMHSTSQKRLPQPWRNMGKLQNREGERSIPFLLCERAHMSQNGWGKWKAWVHNGLCMHSQEFTCPTSQKHTFQKWVTFQIRIWPAYISHPKEVNSFTNFRWVGIKDKNGSWPLCGFSP